VLLVNSWLPYIKNGLANGSPGIKLVLKRSRARFQRQHGRREMKTYYQITAEEIGIVLLRKRKIAKALRRWLREKGLTYEYNFYIQ
jgi:hypothetical protein